MATPATDASDGGELLFLNTDVGIGGWDIGLTVLEGLTIFDASSITFPVVFSPFASGIVGSWTPQSVRMSGSNFGTNSSPGNLFEGLGIAGGTLAEPGLIEVYDYLGGASLGTFSVVPEPMTMSLLALGGLGLLRRRRLS